MYGSLLFPLLYSIFCSLLNFSWVYVCSFSDVNLHWRRVNVFQGSLLVSFSFSPLLSTPMASVFNSFLITFKLLCPHQTFLLHYRPLYCIASWKLECHTVILNSEYSLLNSLSSPLSPHDFFSWIPVSVKGPTNHEIIRSRNVHIVLISLFPHQINKLVGSTELTS